MEQKRIICGCFRHRRSPPATSPFPPSCSFILGLSSICILAIQVVLTSCINCSFFSPRFIPCIHSANHAHQPHPRRPRAQIFLSLFALSRKARRRTPPSPNPHTMSLMTIYLYSILFITFFTFTARRIYYWQRLRHIPGPTSAAWTIWWQLSNALSGRYHERLKKAADTYGMKSLYIKKQCNFLFFSLYCVYNPYAHSQSISYTKALWCASDPTSCSLLIQKCSVACLQFAAATPRASSTQAARLSPE